MQRLSPGEEESLRNYILQLAEWGHPCRIEQLYFMAKSLLHTKGDTKSLGVTWHRYFLSRHPTLRMRFAKGMERERYWAEDPVIMQEWFTLFDNHRIQYAVEDNDIWNMDEKGMALGDVGTTRVIIGKNERQARFVCDDNREWVSIIEGISMGYSKLQPWVIFKGKKQQRQWWRTGYQGHIALSENGWTDNELGLRWLTECFHEETKASYTEGRFRMLCVDGHSSHITTAVIEFCIEKKIILLCLPPHTTHLLQPLDLKIFSPLANAYRKGIRNRCKIGASYSLNKMEFLDIFEQAREEAITPSNMESAWRAAGLKPWNPNIVLLQLPKTLDQQTPQRAADTSQLQNGTCPTPGNMAELQTLLDYITANKVTGDALISKLGKAACRAMADSQIQKTVAAELVEAAKATSKKSKQQYYGNARVLDHATVMQREADAAQKEMDDTFKELGAMAAKLFPKLLPPKASMIKLTGNGNAKELSKEMRNWRHLSPSIFQSDTPEVTSAQTPTALGHALPKSLTKAVTPPQLKRKASSLKASTGEALTEKSGKPSTENAVAETVTVVTSRNGRAIRTPKRFKAF
jgi:hypothetical protein